MFGALNKFISKLGDEPKEQGSGARGASGFQVLRNKNEDFPLEPWFDFIVGINGRTIDNPDPNLFLTEIRNCAGTNISLGIWSAKGQRIREIYVNVPQDSPSLGISVQWMQLSITEDVWHILDVMPNSPADLAGLLPYGDYVIGSSEVVLAGETSLVQLIEDSIDRPIHLFVYNHEYNVTRPIEITPNRHWGGQGALGCTLGFGALHRIPAPLDEPPAAPGETVFASTTSFDEKRSFSTSPDPGAETPFPPSSSSDFLIPANLPMSVPPKDFSLASAKRKSRAPHNISPSATASLDQYFEEGEQKSRELDYAPKSSSVGNIPPPPKPGPPPKAQSSVPSKSE